MSLIAWSKVGKCCGVPCGPLDHRPAGVHMGRKPGKLHEYWLDLVSAISVFVVHVLTMDTILSTLCAVLAVLGCYHYAVVITMPFNFSVLMFGCIFPITMTISQAFARRECALKSVNALRCYALCVFVAHRCWDWAPFGDGGRRTLPKGHANYVKRLLYSMFNAIETYCLLPRGGHARFVFTRHGVREAEELQQALTTQTRRVERGVGRLAQASEALKRHGFPSGEASRVSQYIQKLDAEWELIRAMKE